MSLPVPLLQIFQDISGSLISVQCFNTNPLSTEIMALPRELNYLPKEKIVFSLGSNTEE
jgi:hypothetical protein